MADIALSLSTDLLDRLRGIAEQKDLSLADCAQQAVLDYIESWEDFGRTLVVLENSEDNRVVLRAVNK